MKNQNLTKEEIQKETLFTPYKPLTITEETRRNVLEHTELHKGLSVREKKWNSYTDEEWEKRESFKYTTSRW